MSQEINTRFNQGVQWFTVSILVWSAIDRWCLWTLTGKDLPMAIGLSILCLSLMAILYLLRRTETVETPTRREEKSSSGTAGIVFLGLCLAVPFSATVYFALQHFHNPALPLYLKGFAILSINGMGIGLAHLWQTYVLSRQHLLMQEPTTEA